MPVTGSEIYEFGDFRLNAAEYRLERSNGERVDLADKALETLCVLVRNAGHLVEKDQLLEQVWPNAFVEENNLNKCIYAIRHALGERPGQPMYIETVRKHGYRFVADIRSGARPESHDDLGTPTNAFQAYHLARYHYCQMTPSDLLKSRAYLNQALEHDPAYAPAYAALAEQAVQEVVAGLQDPAKGYPEARAALGRAFDLDPRSVDYYSAAGFVGLLSDWDFSGARQHLVKALDINPHHAFANSSYGQVLMFKGMSNEARPFLCRAAQLDPMNLVVQNLLPISSFLSRQYERAIEECDRMLALYPDFIVALWMRCWSLEQTGRTEEAIAEYERALDKPYGKLVLRWMGYAYAVAGEREKALATADHLAAERTEHYISPTHLAALYAGLGDTDKALSYLAEGVAKKDPWMLWIGADPRFDSLRGNPDFDEIVSQVIPADPLPIHVFDQSNVKLPRLTESGAHAIVSIDDWEVLKDVHSDPHRPPPQPLAPASTDPAPGMGSRLIASIVIVAVAVSAGLLGWSLWPSGASERISLHQKRLTTGGQVTRVAMGPDGRYAAVVQNAAIKLFDLESGEERLLVAAEERMRILTIAFRPDGKAIYFGKRPVETTPVTLYVMPLEGGEPVKILEDVYGSLAFSPDQKKLAFLRRYPELNEFNLLTADIDGTNISKLASSRMPERFEGGPSWSPDGRTILCPIISVEGGFHYSIAMVDPSTGSITSVPNQRWTWLLYAVWLPDSKSVLLTAQGGTDVNAQLWRVDTVTGDAKKVTNDSFIYEALSGSSDGRTFTASKVRQTSHIWIMGDPPAQITTGFDKYDGVDGLAWSPDGALFYHSRASEREAIWRMRPDGSEAKEVTTDSGGGFDVSPDGRFLVFERQGPGSSGLHLMDMSMGTQRQLTQNMLASTPVFSKDGSTIFFSKYENKLSLWEISTALGGEARVVSDEFQAARFPAVSPSGRYTAFAISRAVTGELQSAIAIRDNGSKTIIATVPIKTGLGGTYEKATIQWSPDELELYLLHIDLPASRSNIAKIRIADGTVSSVTDFADGRIFNFAVDPITGRIAFARGTVERDAALIQIERPL